MPLTQNSIVSNLKNTATDTFGGVTDLPFLDNAQASNSLSSDYNKLFGDTWTINAEDWWKVFAYRFTVEKTSGEGNAASSVGSDKTILGASKNVKMHFALPIPPQSLLIKPVIPSQVTPTFGGVVEEVSPVKFWVINMAGTAGIAPSRQSADSVSRSSMSGKFRESIKTTGLLAGLAADANKTIAKLGGVTDTLIDGGTAATQAAQSGDILGAAAAAAGGVTGAINTALLPPLPYSGSGVDNTRNGFTESQELQKFFFMYQRLKANNPKNYNLYFTNFKTDQKWRVIIKDFMLQQNSENPHLYRYQITLQGWDVKSSSADGDKDRDKAQFDRFGPKGDLKAVNVLNPADSGVNSAIKGQMKLLNKGFK